MSRPRTRLLRGPSLNNCGVVDDFIGAGAFPTNANPVCGPTTRLSPLGTCPVIAAVFSPTAGSTDVNPLTTIAQIIFSINPTTVDSFTATVNGHPISGNFAYDPTTDTATFVSPSREAGTVTPTVVINAGTPCEQTFTWSFTYAPV